MIWCLICCFLSTIAVTDALTAHTDVLVLRSIALDPIGGLPSSWDGNDDPCTTYQGVTCNSLGHVTSIKLDGVALNQNIMQFNALSLLPAIEVISMRNCQLTGIKK